MRRSVLPNMIAAHRKDLASVGVIVALAVLFMGESLLPTHMLAPLDIIMGLRPWSVSSDVPTMYNGLPSDKVLYIQPIKVLAGQSWRSGLPLWEPRMLGGYPSIGNAQAGIFYPGTLAYVFLSGATASDLVALFHLIAAGLGMFGFLRALRLRHAAALLGALVFMFNTGFLTWLMWDSVAGAMVWLPWILWAFEVAIRSNRLWISAPGAVTVALSYLGGHLQWALYAMLAFGLYTLFRLLQPQEVSRRRILVVTVIIGGAGTALAAIQLLPTLEYIAAGHRGALSFVEFSQALDWSSFLMLWVPKFFGSGYLPPDWWGPINYNESIIYVGIAPLILAITALISRRRVVTLFFGVLGLLGLLWASGTDAYRLLSWLPGFNSLGPTRLRYLVVVSLSVLSALGLDWLLGSDTASRRRAVWSIVISALLPGLIYVFARAPQLPTNLKRLAFVQAQEGVFVVWLILAAAALLAGIIWKPRGHNLLAGICILALFDLWPVGAAYQRPISTQYYYPTTPAITAMMQDRDLFRVMTTRRDWTGGPFKPDLPSMYGLQDVGGYDSQYQRRYLDYVKAIDQSGPPVAESNFLSPSHFDSPLIDLLNVKYAITLDKSKVDGWQLISKDGMRVYMRTQPLPRAWISAQAVVINDDRAILDRLAMPDFNPRQTVILEQAPLESLGSADSNPAGTVNIDQYANTHLSLTAHMQRSGWLVLSEMFYPGWHATVDGVPTNIYRADYILRTIPLPPGAHQVKLSFMPDSFVIGAAISLGTLLLLTVGVLAWQIENRRARASKQEIQNESTH